MTFTVRPSDHLLAHLSAYHHDGSSVAEALFAGGRLCYPGRHHVEQQLGCPDPYGLGHESRVLEGPGVPAAQIRLLAGLATDRAAGIDPTLDLLWHAHRSHRVTGEGPSLDRLVASLVALRALHDALWEPGRDRCFWPALLEAGAGLYGWMQAEGLPPSEHALEEICDGAMPACIGLNLVEI